MIQYWIQVPIENAKETINRFLADNSLVLTSYDTYQADYTFETEAVKFNLINGLNYDFNTIYFGEVRIPAVENSLRLSVFDGSGTIPSFYATFPVASGRYPYIIFNEITSLPNNDAYFYGYKFIINPPPPQYNYLLTEAGEIIETETGDLIII